ncbi:unnamed protein product [Lupinus luteus]|uniref:Uncharacterized protein n=1 Tax=Lupinus luteus TaxID=3873 RepID=A0AAV1WQ88_LUPLU
MQKNTVNKIRFKCEAKLRGGFYVDPEAKLSFIIHIYGGYLKLVPLVRWTCGHEALLGFDFISNLLGSVMMDCAIKSMIPWTFLANLDSNEISDKSVPTPSVEPQGGRNLFFEC